MTIAGHEFTERMEGRTCMCGRRWVDISGVTKEDIGKMYYCPRWLSGGDGEGGGGGVTRRS
jgi:hypothetical protein